MGGASVFGGRQAPSALYRVWAYQSVAHGADGICYFRWRTSRYGTEQYWEIPLTVTSGNTTTLNNLVPVIYAANSTIPNGAGVQYWMEGVKPGNITLKFTYTSADSSTVLTTQQTFLVCTQQSKTAWQQEIRQAIALQTGTVNMNAYKKLSATPPFFGYGPFINNKIYVQNVYGFYQQLYIKSDDLFLWAGLAKMAGAPIYAGMSDAEYARTITILGTLYGNSVADFIQDTLLDGNWVIFDDLAWQFYAYQTSGIWALRYVDSTAADNRPTSRAIDMVSWEEM